jgi:predicted DNA-binding transcriptional regulator AlpA
VTRLLRAREVAALLGVALHWWYRHRRALEAEGFPAPVRLSRGVARWDPAAIEGWLAARRGDVSGWQAKLDMRFESLEPPAGRGHHGTQAHPLSD